ncbi:MAG: TetR/AcrR family transcriptional regulator [Aestuariibacter sp.]
MRSAEFDREQVLRSAIDAFIDKGYTKTSMQDLKAATGLHPGSIYCAFESKKGLMLAAIAQYDKDKSEEFAALFEGKKAILEGIRNYLKCTVMSVSSECAGNHRACLTQKALSEVGADEPEIAAAIKASMTRWQCGFVKVFEQALGNGEISDSRSPEQRMQSLVMGIFGLRTFAQTQRDPELLNALAEQLFEDVCR